MEDKATQSFTLIELLVVITVIGILALIAYPAYTSVQERAKATADLNNLRQIGLATQMYMNDNDGVIFSTAAGAGTWMSQLEPKYLPAWKVFQSPFDTRASSEAGTSATPISYGLNGNPAPVGGSSIAGLSSNKITNPSVFILFAPAQASPTPSPGPVTFQGTAGTAAPGVTVLGQGSNKAQSNPGGIATAGDHSKGQRIDACMADLHVENMLWSVFTNNTNSTSDSAAAQRWSP
jgi:prepilin-type N-terminal cleavage/methylation domain-containing protein